MDLADYLLPQPPEDRGSWRWATVTAVSPLRVRLDGDSTALDLTPDALGPVRVDDRVWCQIVGRRVVVHPVSRGPLAMAAGTVLIAAQTITAGTYASTTITFPVDRFDAVPVVVTSLGSAGGGTSRLVPRTSGASTAGTTLYVANTGTTDATFGADLVVTWIAVQMTPSSGAG